MHLYLCRVSVGPVHFKFKFGLISTGLYISESLYVFFEFKVFYERILISLMPLHILFETL